jgi:hypothetical protein
MTKEKKLKEKLKELAHKLLIEAEAFRVLEDKYDILKEAFDTLTEIKEESERALVSSRGMRVDRLEDEIYFLRHLITDLAVPADKLKIMCASKEIPEIDRFAKRHNGDF